MLESKRRTTEVIYKQLLLTQRTAYEAEHNAGSLVFVLGIPISLILIIVSVLVGVYEAIYISVAYYTLFVLVAIRHYHKANTIYNDRIVIEFVCGEKEILLKDIIITEEETSCSSTVSD